MDSKQFVESLIELFTKGFEPPERLSVPEWADKYRFLSPEGSSQPGRFVTSRVEAARGPMMAVTEKGIHKITVVGPTQLMKTEFINNIVGYFMHNKPRPIVVMQPKEDNARLWSLERLDPMIRDTPVLTPLVPNKAKRESGNEILKKSFPGGYVAIIGANSAANVASRPVPVVLCDEVDKYPLSVEGEGDPIDLITERGDTFPDFLIVIVCSPTTKNRSRVWKSFEESDQRFAQARCPHCGEFQVLDFFECVHWPEGKPELALYYCKHCGEAWSEKERQSILAPDKLIYIATKETKDHAGFWVNKLYSPWKPVSDLAKKWEKAKGNPEKEQVFYNTNLAICYEEQGEAPPWKTLYNRRISYKRNIVPNPACVLTAGVDIQKDRIEVEILAWGRWFESWPVDYRVFHGDISNIDDPESWGKLEELLNETFEHENGGDINIAKMCVDSSDQTRTVYDWVEKVANKRVIAIKGQDSLDTAIGTINPVYRKVGGNGKKIKRGLKLWRVGVSFLKENLYGILKREQPTDKEIEEKGYPRGWAHFPDFLEEEYFKQLTGEDLITSSKGQKTWRKNRNRNEVLDCRVYNRAAASALGMDRWKEDKWKQKESEYSCVRSHPEKSDNETSAKSSSKPKKKKKVIVKKRKSSWL